MKRRHPSLVVLVGFIIALEACIYLIAVELSASYSALTQTAYILERFEDNGWAVLERDAETTFDFPRVSLPGNAQEGDVLVFSRFKDGTLVMQRDEKETARRHQTIKLLRESLPRAPEGDLEL